MTALVGPSGGGKTTVAHLLARFHDVDATSAGGVLLDGLDLRRISPTWLRKGGTTRPHEPTLTHPHPHPHLTIALALALALARTQVVGLVTQEPVLLPGTIGENISYGRPGASQDEVEAAARQQRAAFIRELPDGYATELREGAASRSGSGSGSRLRARCSRPQGARGRAHVCTRLGEGERTAGADRLSAGRTTLVVAHRLSTVRNADSIAVLHGGKVVEQGTHDELLKLRGEYAAMVAANERYEHLRS